LLAEGLDVGSILGSACGLLNNSSNSLKSLRISIELAPELIDRRKSLLSRTAQPALQVLPDLRVTPYLVDLYDLVDHTVILPPRAPVRQPAFGTVFCLCWLALDWGVHVA
jgi:hypothetical protein